LEYPITGYLRNCTRKWRVGFELLMDIVRLWGNPLYMKCQVWEDCGMLNSSWTDEKQ
jgi:hypothetical protein